MPEPALAADAFAALVAKAGIPFTAAQCAPIHAVWGAMEAMQASVRTPPAGVAPLSAGAAAVEPAVIFVAERG
jgi:hypothetical protein